MYDELFEAWKKEKESTEIQSLPRDFYAKLADYMKKMREERRMLDEKTTRANLMQRELENVEKMIEELVQIRYEKALKQILAEKTMPKQILTEEAKLYQEFLPLAESYRTFLKNMLRGRLSSVERKEKPKLVLVRLLRSVPAIIGSDLKTYGSFKPEDIATLPTENANILIKQGAAVEVEAE